MLIYLVFIYSWLQFIYIFISVCYIIMNNYKGIYYQGRLQKRQASSRSLFADLKWVVCSCQYLTRYRSSRWKVCLVHYFFWHHTTIEYQRASPKVNVLYAKCLFLPSFCTVANSEKPTEAHYLFHTNPENVYQQWKKIIRSNFVSGMWPTYVEL